jgi:hypothetical protein
MATQADSENTETTMLGAMDAVTGNIEQAKSVLGLMLEGLMKPNGHLVSEIPYSASNLFDVLHMLQGLIARSGNGVQTLYQMRAGVRLQ